MQSSDIPAKFPIPFANGAGGSYIRAIPTASQIGTHDGWASLTDGFPPLTFNPVAAGGVPPFGQDFNGVLKQDTAWARWQAAGAPVPWDSAFSSAIGGYPRGAIVASATTPLTQWLCTAENNTTNPDTGGLGWQALTYGVTSIVVFAANSTWTCPPGVTRIRIKIWGGGGAGGYNTTYAGGGGGSGGYAEGFFTVVPGTTYTVTIGAGGVFNSVAGAQGQAGGTSSFGSLISATGGTGGGGGNVPTAAGGAPGGGIGGQLNAYGSYGGDGAQSTTSSPGGTGGIGGGPGNGRGASGFASGTNALGPGGGGGGGGSNGAGSGASGGAGAAGLIILELGAG